MNVAKKKQTRKRAGVDMSKVDVRVLDASLAELKLDPSGMVSQRVARLVEHFRANTKTADLAGCDTCGGDSDIASARCPYCGDADIISSPAPAPPTSEPEPELDPDEPWSCDDLLRNAIGVPKRNLANVMTVLVQHPDWSGVLAYDEFAERVVKLTPAPTRSGDAPASAPIGDWTDEDAVRTAAWLQTVAALDVGVQVVEQAVAAVAHKQTVHPVRDWLDSIKWDGSARLDTFLSTYFGAPDNTYTRAVGARWMISAVARVFDPGCQVDCMLVLESEQQGIGKSTGLEALASKEWFADTGISIGDKDSYQALRRVWIYEFAELSSIRGREVARVKNFVSARVDHYRPSFGRRTRDFPRQVVFCGTTNDSEYLTDPTGGRRFWPVRCERVNVEHIRRDRAQLWAEARQRFQRGERWYVDTPELRALCETEQTEREPVDAWTPKAEEWLANPTKRNEVDLPDGKLDTSAGITTTDLLVHAIGLPIASIERKHETRAGTVLRKLGWKPRQVSEPGKRVRRYFPPAQPAQPKRRRVAKVVQLQLPKKPTHSQPAQPAQRVSTHAHESKGGMER